jgi:diguanylate cyclase (GGDEF)-like protein
MPDPSSIWQHPATVESAAAGPSPGMGRDPLTGLFQQDYLIYELEEALVRSRVAPVEATLALLQLENFYEIRTWVGRSEANLLLSDIAHALQESLPANVLLCRCQHYEFALFLCDQNSLHARTITDRVKQALHKAISASIPPQLELKCGVGLAQLDQRMPSADVVFARARHSLILAHYQARNAPQLSPPAPVNSGAALRQLEQALQENKLGLIYQPIVSLHQDGLQHYEVRTTLPRSLASQSTSMLFDAAVQNALGDDIDRWVIGNVIDLLSRRNEASLRLTISLTHNSLVDPRFFDWLQSKLHQHPHSTEQIVFQISEIDVLIAQHHMEPFCESLNQLCIKLCISNFGCTANPFRYLHLLQAHYVKLDVSLLENIDKDRARLNQLGKTVDELHEHGLRVIAAMIENMRLLPLLWRSRVNFVQGFCMQKPSTSLEFEILQDQTIN